MQAIALTEYGGPEVLTLTELPDPVPGPDGVLIRTAAAGVNPVDTSIRRGALDGAFPSAFPLIPGWDVAGVVEAVGPAVTGFAPGDRVMAYARKDHIQHGTYAELVRVAERDVACAPRSVKPHAAAGLPLAGLTAAQALAALDVGEHDTLLIHGASGGVGSFAVQLGRLRGARVIGTASEGNHDYLRELGAEPAAYGEGLADRLRDLAPEGVTAALDLAGGDAIEVSSKLLAPGGRQASIVDAAGVRAAGGRYVFVRPDGGLLAGLGELVDSGKLRVEVATVFPLSDAARAHEAVESRHTRGKVVLEVDA